MQSMALERKMSLARTVGTISEAYISSIFSVDQEENEPLSRKLEHAE